MTARRRSTSERGAKDSSFRRKCAGKGNRWDEQVRFRVGNRLDSVGLHFNRIGQVHSSTHQVAYGQVLPMLDISREDTRL
jgi:hypothetical protein